MSQVSITNTASLLSRGNSAQFRHVEGLYSVALGCKANGKSRGPDELLKLDHWYQTVLPGLLRSRFQVKDGHLKHEELVSITKWKLARGKFRPKLKELVTMNSPRFVETESRKAFRALLGKKKDLTTVLAYLCNLKGVGPSTASAILTAAQPSSYAFMADECLEAIPEIERIDYSVKEYLILLEHINNACTRLTSEDNNSNNNTRDSSIIVDSTSSEPVVDEVDEPYWTPHRVELILWTHSVLRHFQPDLLTDLISIKSGSEDGLSIVETPDSESPPSPPLDQNDLESTAEIPDQVAPCKKIKLK